MREMPAFVAATSNSTAYGGLPLGVNLAAQAQLAQALPWEGHFAREFRPDRPAPPPQEKPMSTPSRRLVQVFIADPHPQLPLDACLIYKGEQVLTDSTDQELFFEIPVADLLAKHNEKRIAVRDKDVRDEVRYLEPARVRDLKMVVVTVASF